MTAHPDPDGSRVVVMTGATAGIGACAVAELAARSDILVLVGARGANRVVPEGVDVLPLDLTSLGSVREFAEAVRGRLGDRSIDALVLNAGVQVTRTGERTVDGYDVTFAVNHLAHYLLARLLSPLLRDGARIVITTSDTHDPTVVPIGPRTLDPQALAQPARPGLGFRAYAASKLCNLLTARSLADRAELRDKGIGVIAYNPGLTGGTNLFAFGAASQRLRALTVYPLLRLVGRVNPTFAMGRPERAGTVLAQLADGSLTPPPGRLYVSLVRGEVTYPEPSTLARSDRARDDLWRRSAVMVGLDA